MKSYRTARVAEVIREVASETILFEMRDPRVKMVTVTRVEVSGDLQHAKVYVSIMGSERDQNLSLYGLKRAAGFIQSKLADRMKSRFVPILEFVLDQGIKNSIEVARLIHEALGNQPETLADVPVPDDDDEDDEDEDDVDDEEWDEDEDEEEDEAAAQKSKTPPKAEGTP